MFIVFSCGILLFGSWLFLTALLTLGAYAPQGYGVYSSVFVCLTLFSHLEPMTQLQSDTNNFSAATTPILLKRLCSRASN